MGSRAVTRIARSVGGAGLAALMLAVAPAAHAVTLEEMRAPMRDGVELALDVYRPSGGGPFPVIVTLTPYHVIYKRIGPQLSEGYRFVRQGYAFVLADVRGTYESGGCWDYGGIGERHDGHDLVEWIAAQPWSNGRVAMIGNSYDGTTANAAAVEAPPHLATIVPISAISRWYGYAYTHGVRHTLAGETADYDPPADTPADFALAYGGLPPPEPGSVSSAQQLAMRWNPCDRVEQLLHGYDTEPDFDAFWQERDYLALARRIRAPVLVAHGLLDQNVKPWEGTQLYEAVAAPKALVVGQWRHSSPPWENWDDYLDRWFAHWLRGEPNGIEAEDPVIVQGSDGKFHSRRRWAGTDTVAVTLGSGDPQYFDDGALTESEVLRAACSGRCVRIAFRDLAGVHIAGRPRLRLRATSDRSSTHLAALLVDVAPDGAARPISRAFLNARYRETLERGTELEPGRPTTFELEFVDSDHLVASDHHLELVVASSSTTWVLSDEQRATNTLHLGESRLLLPVPGVEAGSGPVRAEGPRRGRTQPCRTSAVVRLPRRARRPVVRVNGRPAPFRRRRTAIVVALSGSRDGRYVVRMTARVGRRRITVTRRVRGCPATTGQARSRSGAPPTV